MPLRQGPMCTRKGPVQQMGLTWFDHVTVYLDHLCDVVQAKLDLKTTECNTAQGSFEGSFCDKAKQAGSDQQHLSYKILQVTSRMLQE